MLRDRDLLFFPSFDLHQMGFFNPKRHSGPYPTKAREVTPDPLNSPLRAPATTVRAHESGFARTVREQPPLNADSPPPVAHHEVGRKSGRVVIE
jgi:hypothetical protein